MSEQQERPGHDAITFGLDGEKTPVISIKANGDFYVKGRLVTNDMELYEAIRDFFVTGKIVK